MANLGTIKDINITSIRKVLEKNESMSKSYVVKYTGLSFLTVSKTIKYLVELGELIEYGIKDSSGGRCVKSYRLNLICMEQ